MGKGEGRKGFGNTKRLAVRRRGVVERNKGSDGSWSERRVRM
jgi:hypothetical protein